MVIVKHPFNRGRNIHVDKYDRSDIIVENSSSTTLNKQFKDLPATNQLTQNSMNFSSKTRADYYNDVEVKSPAIVGRIERGRLVQVPGKYHDHR